MEEKEFIRKSVPIPNRWLKELHDLLGIKEETYLSWMLFPHEQNGKLGFKFSEERIKEIVKEIYHPTEEDLKKEDEWEKEITKETGYSKMDFWKNAMKEYPLYQFANWENALDPLKLGKRMANLYKISKELNVPLDSSKVIAEYQKHFGGCDNNVAIAVYQPIYFPVEDLTYGAACPIILPDDFEVTKDDEKKETNE